jgi:hypothetical protein
LPVDARTDVYALGCVLYECLVGKAPFDRDGDAEINVMHAHLINPPPLLTASRPDLPKALNRVLASALAKSKEDRYDTCGQLIEATRVAARQRSTTTVHADREDAGAGAEAPAASAGAITTEPPIPALSSAEAAVVAAPVTVDSGAHAPPARAEAPPVQSAGPPPQPPESGDRGRGAPRDRRTWLFAGAAIVVAALLAAVAVYAVTRDSNSSATPPQTTGTITPPPASRPVAKGLAGVVQKDVWDKCAVSSTPQPGAVESAICLPPANSAVFFPDRLDLAIYPDAAARKKAFEELRASDPASAALVAGKGDCNSNRWNGFGIWRHALDGKLGGQRYCYVDAKHDTVIVWTHDRRETPSHLDFIGVARVGGRGNGPSLFNWWRFWHEHLGKCPLPGCVARLP